MKQKLIAWFSARNARERTLVLLMGFALLWLILWYGVWLPLQNAIDEGKAAINRARDTQTWMLTQAQQHDLRVRRVLVENPQQALTESLKANKLAPSQLAIQGQKATLTLEPVAFAALFQWYVALNRSSGIQLESITLTPLAKNDNALKVEMTLFWGKGS